MMQIKGFLSWRRYFRLQDGSSNAPWKTDAKKTGYSTRAVTRDDAEAYLFKLDSKTTSLGEVSKAIKHPWVL